MTAVATGGTGAAGLTAAGIGRVQSLDWVAASPVLAVGTALVLVVLLDAAGPGAPRLRRLHDLVALAGLAGAGAALAYLAAAAGAGGERATLCSPPAAGDPLEFTSCSYVVSPLTMTLQALVVGGAVISLLVTLDGPAARDRAPHHALLLSAVAGALVLAGSRDLATFVVAFETSSLPVVGLVALRRDAQGAQGALTLLLAAVTSLGLLLLGVALVLLATGSLYTDRIAATVADPTLPAQVRAVAVLGVLLAAAGVAFKLSAVPFHLWTPDTYAGAPLAVTAFLAVVSKAAAVAALMILLGLAAPALGDAWAPAVAVVAAVTVTVGNLVALRQQVAVRLLAWSTVAQAGWVLLPLAAVEAGTTSSARGAVAASVGYMVAYAAASLTVFTVVVLLARHHPDGEEHTLAAYRGLARREPVASALLGLALLSLAGLPPGVAGLVAKVVAVRPVVQAGTWWLAVVAAVNVALGLVYYLRWTALLVAPPQGRVPTWRVKPAEGLALGVAAAAVVALSVWPQAVAGLVPTALR